ncbi:NADAR family protein [Parendozoicomonas haliclonae]|nr:NADAR family protein [Parendozoicomonas haliclonae]
MPEPVDSRRLRAASSRPRSETARHDQTDSRRGLNDYDVCALSDDFDTSSPNVSRGFPHTLNTRNWHSVKSTRRSPIGQLYFYRPGEYFELTNTRRCPISVDHERFQSVEHYYQCMKLGGPYARLGKALAGTNPTVGNSSDTADAARYGRRHQTQKPRDWKHQCNGYMRKGLAAKFDLYTNPELSLRLLFTAADRSSLILVEASPTDAFWGQGANGHGENKLGLMLMERREALYEEWMQLSPTEKQSFWGAYRTVYSDQPLSYRKMESKLIEFYGPAHGNSEDSSSEDETVLPATKKRRVLKPGGRSAAEASTSYATTSTPLVTRKRRRMV